MFKKIPIALLVLGPSLAAADTVRTTNYFYSWYDRSLPGHNHYHANLSCPSDYPKLLSGSCGHRDSNSAQTDIKVNGAGGANGNETSAWRCMVDNTGGDSRAVRIGIVCGK